MNTEDPNPTNEFEIMKKDLESFLGFMVGYSIGSWMIVKEIDHDNIDFFWYQFASLRYFNQIWVSIPNQNQLRFRIRNKSPPIINIQKHNENKINSCE